MHYFAAAADAVGRTVECIELHERPTILELCAELELRHGKRLSMILEVSAFLVEGQLTRERNYRLDTRRVDILPPFAGG